MLFLGNVEPVFSQPSYIPESFRVSTENFMNKTLAELLNVPIVSLTGTVIVKALNGCPLGGGKVSKHTVPLQVCIGNQETPFS